MRSIPRSPRLARLIAAAAVPASIREFVLGDLEEQFAAAWSREGPLRARYRYWIHVAGLVRNAGGLYRRARPSGQLEKARRSFEMSSVWRDLRLGLRAILRSPGYSVITGLTLALAIGANTLLFSIANPLVVRALPIKDADRLGWILLTSAERGIERGRASLPEFLEWRAAMTSFSQAAAMEFTDSTGGTLTGHGDARRVQVARVTSNLPQVWGLQPIQGRLFLPGEDEPGRAMAGVLSHRYWRDVFASDPAVVGRTYMLDGRPFTVVGVMHPSIELGGLATIDLWIPLPVASTGARDLRSLMVIGRLAPGATLESADAELQTIFAGQTRDHPLTNAGWHANVRPTHAALSSGDTWVILGLLAIVVVFVLLIACANLANLVLARLVARRQESAVRIAMGASRWQLVRPLLVESFLLSLLGGVAGLGLAYGGLKAINAAAYEPFMRQIGIDGNVLIFNVALSLATPLLFTLWPALSTGRAMAAETLHGARTAGTRTASRRRNILIGAQVALALSLLVVSTLFSQSMLFLRRVDMGFDAGPILTYRFDLPASRYPDDASRAALVRDLEARLAAIPGATGAAVTTHMPVLESDQARPLSGTRHDGMTEQDRPWASCFAVTPGFFDAAGISRVAGRLFEPRDRQDAEPVAVLNRLAADRYFDDAGSAIGRRIVIHDAARGKQEATIVGVVSDTRDAQLLRTSPQIYVPLDQWPAPSMRALVRSADPGARAKDVQAVMRALDPDVAVAELKLMSTIVDEEMSSSKILNALFVSYALLALVLAAGGLFGVISYSVGQRRREIGVRLALGASPRAIARMIVREGLTVTAVGAVVGLGLASVLAHLSASLLFGITPRDPATFASVFAVIIAVALAATWAPAARAMKVDPARTLRAE